MAYQAEQIADLVTSTLKELGRGKFTDISYDLQRFTALNHIMTDEKETLQGGQEVQFNVLVKNGGAAKMVGLYNVDNPNVTDGLETAKVPWRRASVPYSYDLGEFNINAGNEYRILDLIKTRRHMALTSLAEILETQAWGKPTSSDDNLNAMGILYWIVKAATKGFYGVAPSGFTTCAGLSSTTYPNWRNWSGTYSTISATDLVAKIREALTFTQFEAPAKIVGDYNTGDKKSIYTNYTVVSALEEQLRANNDQLGTDLAYGDGQVLIRKIPVEWVPALETDTTNPVYGINWGVFKCVGLAGEWMTETKPFMAANQHKVLTGFTDCTFNFICRDRRRNFVLYQA